MEGVGFRGGHRELGDHVRLAGPVNGRCRHQSFPWEEGTSSRDVGLPLFKYMETVDGWGATRVFWVAQVAFVKLCY
jgi:hypothetical protein